MITPMFAYPSKSELRSNSRPFSSLRGGIIFGLLLALHLAGGSFAFAQTLAHGPVVGGVTDSSANVFLRSSQETTVALRYGTDPDLMTYQVTASATTSAASDFTKIIALSSLTPEQTYYLNPVVNGVAQLSAPPYPTFRTFPAGGSARDRSLLFSSPLAPSET